MEIPKISKVNHNGVVPTEAIFIWTSFFGDEPRSFCFESHEIADQAESMLSERFSVFDTDIHIEPAPTLKMKS